MDGYHKKLQRIKRGPEYIRLVLEGYNEEEIQKILAEVKP